MRKKEIPKQHLISTLISTLNRYETHWYWGKKIF